MVLTLVIPLLAKQENSRSRQIKEALEHARLDLIEIRRDIHQHPEVSGKEERTSRLVSERFENSWIRGGDWRRRSWCNRRS